MLKSKKILIVRNFILESGTLSGNSFYDPSPIGAGQNRNLQALLLQKPSTLCNKKICSNIKFLQP